MPVNLLWDDPDKSILRFEYQGKWTWEELHNAIVQAADELHETRYRVDTIHDLTDSRGLPPDALARAPSIARQLSNRNGIVVVIGGAFFNTMLSIFNRVYPQFGSASRYKSAHTLDEAYDLIEQSRVSEQS
jgi:hypothetical protein